MTLSEFRKRELPLIFKHVFKVVGKGLKEVRDELNERITALEADAKHSELRYLGIFDRERDYKLGNFVTHKGGLWHANRKTHGELPGDGSDAWTLTVKSGKE